MTTQNQFQSSLFHLQSLDQTLADTKKKVAEENQRVGNFEASIRSRTKEREKQDHVLKTAQVEAKNLELELEDLNTKKAKKEKQVLAIVNARELEAINAEIARLAEAIPLKEGELLESYEKVEKAQAALKVTDEDLHKRTAHVPKLKVDVQKKLAELAALEKATIAERATVAPQVEAGALAKYDAAREKQGVPVLFDIRENACGGCGLPRPSFEWNRLRQNPGNVYECGDCSRLNVYTGEHQ